MIGLCRPCLGLDDIVTGMVDLVLAARRIPHEVLFVSESISKLYEMLQLFLWEAIVMLEGRPTGTTI